MNGGHFFIIFIKYVMVLENLISIGISFHNVSGVRYGELCSKYLNVFTLYPFGLWYFMYVADMNVYGCSTAKITCLVYVETDFKMFKIIMNCINVMMCCSYFRL